MGSCTSAIQGSDVLRHARAKPRIEEEEVVVMVVAERSMATYVSLRGFWRQEAVAERLKVWDR